MQGIITKGIGGFYYIKTEDGLYECKARGKFRLDELTPMVGDKVEIEIDNNSKGTIEKIFERKNKLIRPAVSNISQAIIVFAFKNPNINLDLLNKFLLQCEYNEINAVVAFNKVDLVENPEEEEVVDIIKSAGYEVIYLNAKEGMGIEKIREKLKGNLNVLCGPSGTGKSTIINKLVGKDVMETGQISEKLKRGKHTTRHSELIEVEEGFLVDTPGFSSLSIEDMEKEEIQFLFPEFIKYINGCKFTGCLHYKEPSCVVKNALEQGKIHKKRYEFYIQIIEEKLRGKNNKW